jgi:heat-inducible transcriptional repressor
MTVKVALNDRYKQILQATVKHYIATAEPVGSKTLIEEYDISISSATVRNVMGKLEKAGFLYQPHTSAGRIPSDYGYRVYVDELITSNENLKHSVPQILAQQLNYFKSHYEILLQKITKILAELSGYIALITLPQIASNILHHLQLLPLAEQKIMLVMVIDNYRTESVILNQQDLWSEDELPFLEVIERELQILSNFLNHKLKGKSLTEVANLDWIELDQEFRQYAQFIHDLLHKIQTCYRFTNSTPIVIQGVSKIFRQPEFSHIEQVKILLQLLEQEQEKLFPLVYDSHHQGSTWQKVKITIGSENPLESMQSCSLVSANYYQGKTIAGSVGIIGPTRMAYEETIALVESTADYLSENLMK